MMMLRRCVHMGSLLARRSLTTGPAAISSPLHFLDGRRVQPTNQNTGDVFANLNPATGQLLCSVRESDQNDVNLAVQSARAAYENWSGRSGRERCQLLSKAAAIIRENQEDLAQTEVKDTGKPIWEARFDIVGCADALDFFAALSNTLFGQHIPLQGSTFGYTVREPLGVVGCIGAFNFPFQMASWKSGPALACGNTVVFKPSPLTPLTAVMLGEIYTQAGLPAGCYNVIQGAAQAGELLSNHPDVAKMTFTGSIGTGTRVMKACANDIKKVTLELGGKSPVIIFADCDFENAIKGTLMANFLTQGQVCSNGTRVYVERPLMDKFVKQLTSRAAAMKIGNPTLDDTTVGAMISQQQAEKVLGYIRQAREQGADILCGGERVQTSDPDLQEGWFVPPTVITNVTDDMPIVREEIFGPVVCVMPFDTEEEAVSRANDSEFGLAAGVFTSQLSRAHRVTKQLQAGNIYINNYNMYPSELPFGGYKKSGIGRECGTVCVDYFTQIKTVYVETEDVWCPF